jgi:hypothetical protein
VPSDLPSAVVGEQLGPQRRIDVLFKPTLGTQLSGSLGGIVASHNAGGAYFRARTTPVNPNTTFQQVVRAAFANLASIWTGTLTQAQRDAWDVYADNVKVTNRIGEQVNISGIAHFTRSNVARIQFGHARVDDGPTEFNLGGMAIVSLDTYSGATQTGNFNFNTSGLSDPWANEAGGFMFLFLSRPQNPGINYFRGPYRAIASVTGDPVPPVSPSVTGVPFAITEGQRLFGRAIASTADGRLSADQFFTTLVVA